MHEGHAVATAVGGVLLCCCTQLSGLEDKTFDLVGGGTAAGGGGGGGHAAGGTGGIGGSSTPPLAVPAWSSSFGGPGAETAAAVAVGPSQEVVVGGFFEQQVDFGDVLVAPTGKHSIFIAKLSPTGEPEWARQLGDLGGVGVLDVAVGDDGHVFVAGSFSGTIDLDASHDSVDAADAFVAEYTATGDLVAGHNRVFSGNGAQRFTSLAIDSEGRWVMAGMFEGTIGLGGSCGDRTSPGDDSILFVRLAPDSTCADVLAFTNAANSREQHTLGAAVAADDSAVLTGFARGTVDFGGGTLPGGTDEDIVVIKATSGLAYDWAHRYGDGSAQRGTAVAVEPDGTVLVTGRLQGTAQLDPNEPATTASGADAFLLRLSATGDSTTYGVAFGAEGSNQQGRAVLPLPDGEALLGGSYGGTLECSGRSFPSTGDPDVFLARFDPAGNVTGCQAFNATQSALLTDMAATSPDSMVLFGQFAGELTLGQQSWPSAGQTDLFVTRVVLD